MVALPFTPSFGTGQTLTTGAASASVALAKDDKSIRVYNFGPTNTAFIRFTAGASNATSSDFAVPLGGSVTLYKGNADTFSHIQRTGAVTLYIITGNGGYD